MRATSELEAANKFFERLGFDNVSQEELETIKLTGMPKYTDLKDFRISAAVNFS